MTQALATTDERTETRYCVGCQRHRVLADFHPGCKFNRPTECMECQAKKRGDRQKSMVELAIVKTMTELAQGGKKDSPSLQGYYRSIIEKTGGFDVGDHWVAESLREAFESGSHRAKAEARKFYNEMRKDLADSQTLGERLSQLQPEELQAVAMGILLSDTLTDNSLEVLEEIAGHHGYRLVRIETIDSYPAPEIQQEAVA